MGKVNVSLLLVALLAFLPGAVSSQFDPGERQVKIFGIVDLEGTFLGTLVVAGTSNRGFQSGNEYWRFDERALLEIAEQESLEFAVLATGEWDDPWIVEALGWQPQGSSVEWSHPTAVEWTPQDQSRPPVIAGGTTFDNATLGGLTIQYSERGPASLTWFKLTEGAFMQLEDGAVFERDEEAPTNGSWWHGPIEVGR